MYQELYFAFKSKSIAHSLIVICVYVLLMCVEIYAAYRVEILPEYIKITVFWDITPSSLGMTTNIGRDTLFPCLWYKIELLVPSKHW
jgi:hypothetical protein